MLKKILSLTLTFFHNGSPFFLRAPGDSRFTRIYTLANGFDASLNAGPFWHYPCVALSGDTLLITCTANDTDNRRSAVLMEIPLSSLI